MTALALPRWHKLAAADKLLLPRLRDSALVLRPTWRGPSLADWLIFMATSAGIPTKLMKAQGASTSGQAVALGSDTLKGLWVKAGSGAPNFTSAGIQYVADVTGSNAEDTAIGSRPTLSSVTWAFDASTVAVDLSCGNIVYALNGSDDGLSRYFIIYDSSVGSGDSTYPVIYAFDPGATVSVVSSSYTMTSPTGGFLQFTGGGLT